MAESTAKATLNVDTSQAESALSSLTGKLHDAGEEAKHAKEEHESFSDKLKEGAEKVFYFGEALKKIVEVGKELGELAEFSAQLANLEEKVPVQRLLDMQTAVEGTVDKMTLMRFSLKAMQGDLHLTDAGLQITLEAAHNLANKGFGTTTENADKLMHALESGRTRELKAFNIQLDETKDKHEQLNQVMEKMRELAEEKAPINKNLEAIEQARAAWQDFVTDVKSGLGELVISIAQAIASLLDLMPKSQHQREMEKMISDARSSAEAAYPLGNGPNGTDFSDAAIYDQPDSYAKGMQEAMFQAKFGATYGAVSRTDAAMAAAKKLAQEHGALTVGRLGQRGGAGGDRYEIEKVMGVKLDAAGGLEGSSFLSDAYGKGMKGLIGSGMNEFGSLDANRAFDGGSLINSGMNLFGPSQGEKDLSKNLNERSSALGGAFGAFGSGISSAVDAAITGSESIGKAFMKASADALKSLAIESTVRALYNTAMGIGSLYLSPPAAAGYFAAAGQFALAAAAAGAGAAALGAMSGGGGGPSPGGGGGAGMPSTAGLSSLNAQQGQAQTIIVNVSGAITAGDYKQLGTTIQKAVQSGQQAGSVRPETTQTIRFG